MHVPDYRIVPQKKDVSPQLVANSEAKQILLQARKKVTVLPKSKTVKPPKKKKRLEDEQSQEDAEDKMGPSKAWRLSEADQRRLKSVYRKGPAAYGSVKNLHRKLNSHGKKL